MYYLNIRDLKCKRSSFEEIIAQVKPTVIALTETHTDDSYDLKIENYVEFPNHRNKDGGGVVLYVRKELVGVAVEVKQTQEKLESIWVLIDNGKIKLRIGVVYFPQESDQELKEIYKIIKEQVQRSGENKEAILIMGDFNCKVGSECIVGNHDKVSRAGKKLIKTAEKEGLVIANSMEKCEGRWTREENNSKSVLDYVLEDTELAEHIKKIHDL